MLDTETGTTALAERMGLTQPYLSSLLNTGIRRVTDADGALKSVEDALTALETERAVGLTAPAAPPAAEGRA